MTPLSSRVPISPTAAGDAGRFSPDRDLMLSDADFARIRELIYRRAGIVLAEHKKDMVYSRIGRRVRKHGLIRFQDYLAKLEQDSGGPEWEAFTNALTTNLTAFFRESHHFPLLADLVRDRRGPIRIWSAGASTGEEPYSIAMALTEVLGDKADFQVLATDIDTEALDRARRGIYPMDQVNKLDERRRKRFFQKGSGARSGFARVRPEVAAMEDRFDAIFCRNVMIYFDKDTQAKILNRFAPLMKHDGLLFAGHSESFSYISDRFRLRGQTVYTLADQ
jgi:chemotaxis protein methyltransferase CheR